MLSPAEAGLRLASVVLTAVRRVVPAIVPHRLGHPGEPGARRPAPHVADANRNGWLRTGRGDGREHTAVSGAGLEVTELAFQVRLEPAAVLALERPKVINPPLKLFTRLNKRTHRLAVPLLRVALEALGPRPGIARDLLSLTARLGQQVISLPASPAEGLVRLAPGVGYRLVGGLLRKSEDPGGRIHVVLGRGPHHWHWLRATLRLWPVRLARHQVGAVPVR